MILSRHRNNSNITLITIFAEIITSIILVLAERRSLDDKLQETLEKRSHSEKKISTRAKEAILDELDNDVAFVISRIRNLPNSEMQPVGDFRCDQEQIERMKEFHTFMMKNSEKYRMVDGLSEVTRFLVNNQWTFVTRCLEKLNKEMIRSLRIKRNQLSSIHERLGIFWKITARPSDTYRTKIASDLYLKKISIFDGSARGRGWAEMFQVLYQEKKSSNREISKPSFGYTDEVRKDIDEDPLTGLRYPKDGAIAKLYEYLIDSRCNDLQSNQELRKFLKIIVELADCSHWPKNGVSGSYMFNRKYAELPLGYLALGIVVCDELRGNRELLEKAMENGVAIFSALTENFRSSSDINIALLAAAHGNLNEICANTESLVEICHKARILLESQPTTEMRWILKQMSEIEPVARLAPKNFSCNDSETLKIATLFRSLERIFSRLVSNGFLAFCGSLKQRMNELVKQFLQECIGRVTSNIWAYADETTIFTALEMPRLWVIIEQCPYRSAMLSLEDSLKFAGMLFNGRGSILGVSGNRAEWRLLLDTSVKDLSTNEAPDGLPDSFINYWKYTQYMSLLYSFVEEKSRFWGTKAYRVFIMNWCDIFENYSSPLESAIIAEIAKAVKIASALLRDEFHHENLFSRDSIEPEAKFLLGRLALGYSACAKIERIPMPVTRVIVDAPIKAQQRRFSLRDQSTQ